MGSFISDGKRTIKLKPRYYKGWVCENVYGLTWCGELDQLTHLFYSYVDLVVLDHMPDADERAAIKARFKDVKGPDGKRALDYPI